MKHCLPLVIHDGDRKRSGVIEMKPIFRMNKLKMKYMKSHADMPLAFLRGTRNVLLACLLAAAFMAAEATDKRAREPSNASKFLSVAASGIDQSATPIVGATVLVKGTTSGVQPDTRGMLRTNLPERNTPLAVSFVGYEVPE